MSRRHASRHPARATSAAQRHVPSASPGSGAGTSVAPDLSFRLAVDRLLADLATGDREAPHDTARPADGPGRTAPADAPAAIAAGATLAAASTPWVSTTVPVAGMTCRTCEVRIQKQVGRLPGVQRVRASAAHGRVEVESTAPVAPAAIARAIRAAGYEVGRSRWLSRDGTVWLTAAAGVALVAAIAVVAQATGLTELGSGVGDLSRGGLMVALLLGLAAGVSTCMALVGGLVLALSASFQARRSATGSPGAGLLTQMRPALVFTAGRIVGYGILGAGLGAVGASVAMPPAVTAALMVAVAIAMTILGTRLTGLSPRVAAWSPTLPMGLGRRLGLVDGPTGTYSDARAALLGAASFFLPCGFTQAVQVFALSTGSPAYAGALMAVFAIGTAPGLLAMAGLPALVPGTLRPTMLRLVGVVVLGFALLNAAAAVRLSGIDLPSVGVEAAVAAPPAGAVTADGRQTLSTYQDATGYGPANVAIYAGLPTTWTIDSRASGTCAILVVVPSLGIQVRLHEGPNTIELPALPAGTLAYSCAMGMYSGRITIVDRPSGRAGGAATGG